MPRTMDPGFVLVALSLALLAVFSCLRAANILKHAAADIVVIRVDDIQDYAFHEAQIRLLQHSASMRYPLSLGVIAKDFGLDVELVEAVRAAVRTGCEVAAHGWTHENLGQFTADEQKTQFLRAKNRIWNTLEVDTSVLIPPTYSCSRDTLIAMKQAGYEVVSGYIDVDDAGMTSEGIVSVPATVELSELSGDNWTMRSGDEVMAALNLSIGSNGYAVIATHPQEFLKNGTLDENTLGQYYKVLESISSRYELTTLGRLKPIVESANLDVSSLQRSGLEVSACTVFLSSPFRIVASPPAHRDTPYN